MGNKKNIPQATPIYKCSRCGISGNENEINREGQLHHSTDLHCINRKSCERRIRKNK